MHYLLLPVIVSSGIISLLLFAVYYRKCQMLEAKNRALSARHIKVLGLLEEKIITAEAA